MHGILFFILLFGVQLFQHCSANESSVGQVFVSILPQKYLVERVAGERVNVAVMVGADQSPATYEPSPKQMALLDNSALYFRIGVPFENIWLDVVSELNPNMKIIECCKEIESINIEGHLHGNHAEKENAMDPHIWTSPENAKYIALKVKEALVDAYPVFKAEFNTNLARLNEDLDKLDQEIKARLSQLSNRHIIVSHPSWGYYAKAYGLIQHPIEVESKEVRAKSLVKLIEFAKSRNINRIFSQKQFNKNSADIIAHEINAEVIELDPLAEDYIANLYHVTDTILNMKY